MGLGQLPLRTLGPSFAIARAIIGSLCIQWGMLLVVGLRLKGVEVPQSGVVGGFAALSCDWENEFDTLLSVKFYRDGHEFFRYFPGIRDSPITTFPQPGVYPDQGESLKVHNGSVKFRLKNLDLNSGGTYRCEITTDKPTFRTLYDDRNLSIMALPKVPRVILSGFPSNVQFGDRVGGNCSFVDSYPPAEITLYLNNEKINNSNEIEVIRYNPGKVGQRLTSTTGLRFRVAPKHFQFGVVQVKCEATLFDQRWGTLRNITHQNYQAPYHTAGQNRFSSADRRGPCPPDFLQALFLLSSTAVLRCWS